MTFLEKDLEDIIFETPYEQLSDAGLYAPGVIRRQVKIGNYGICDLVSLDRSLDFEQEGCPPYITVTIFELKQQKIGASTLLQAIKYCKGIERYFNARKLFIDIDVRYKIVLIGKSVETENNFVYLSDFISNLWVMTYSYEFDGIKFKHERNYKLINEGF